MKFNRTDVTVNKLVLLNDHFVNIGYDCSNLTPGADGVIKAGTIVPKNDATAIGVLFQDVVPGENPNGAITVHGFIDSAKLPEAPSSAAKTALNMIKFI